jgi:MoxR-like ATPase
MSATQQIDLFAQNFQKLSKEIHKVIVGQDQVVDEVLISIFSKGHCLLVGVPGLAKTLLVNTISQSLGLTSNRIQFTPDLMPSDIIGSEILDESRQFKFLKGPIFHNIVLADEINRTPPKTQAALLEAMQEKSVTAAGITYKLPAPFFVLATQNPIEQEGTYALPEAQLDRFMFNVWVGYPTFEEEVNIVKATTTNFSATVTPQMSAEDIINYQNVLRELPVTDNVLQYAVGLVAKTRKDDPKATEITKKYIAWGAGPRASQNLIIAAKTHAAVKGKYAPDIEDVRAVALPILRHRIVRNYRAEAEGYSVERIIAELM